MLFIVNSFEIYGSNIYKRDKHKEAQLKSWGPVKPLVVTKSANCHVTKNTVGRLRNHKMSCF